MVAVIKRTEESRNALSLSESWGTPIGITAVEREQVFFNQPVLSVPDEQHSDTEARFYILGQTDSGRELFVVFTTRGNLIRVISARDMNRKERKIYEAL